MELAFGRAARSGSRCCCLRTLTENVFVSAVFGALSALEALCDYALYKSTFYFTLLYFRTDLLHTMQRNMSCCFERVYSSGVWLGSRVVRVLNPGAEGPGFKSQSRRCRVTTVLDKLFTPVVPLFTKQQNW